MSDTAACDACDGEGFTFEEDPSRPAEERHIPYAGRRGEAWVQGERYVHLRQVRCTVCGGSGRLDVTTIAVT